MHSNVSQCVKLRATRGLQVVVKPPRATDGRDLAILRVAVCVLRDRGGVLAETTWSGGGSVQFAVVRAKLAGDMVAGTTCACVRNRRARTDLAACSLERGTAPFP